MNKKLFCRRHNIADAMRLQLGSHLPGREVSWGGVARDNCQFTKPVICNAVFSMMRTASPWRDLPPRLWKLEHKTHRLLAAGVIKIGVE